MKIARLLSIAAAATLAATTASLSQQRHSAPPGYVRTVDGELEPEKIPLHEAAWAVFGMLREMARRYPLDGVAGRIGISEEAVPVLIARVDTAFEEFDALARGHVQESCNNYESGTITNATEYAELSRRQDEEANAWREERVALVLAGLEAEIVAALDARFREVRRNMKWATLDYDKLVASPDFDLARAYAGVCDAIPLP